MALKVPANLTGQQAFPPASQFIIPVPTDNLIAIFNAGVLITLDGAGGITGWRDRIGNVASQAVSTRRPVVTAGRIAPDGVDDYLQTALLPSAAAYVVCKALVKTVAAQSIIFGSQVSGTQRMAMGISTNMRLGATIGSRTVGTFNAGPTLANDSENVLGMAVSAGNVALRVNGAEVLSGAYNASGETVGNLPMWIGGLNFGGALANPSPAHIEHLFYYNAVPADLPGLDTIVAGL